MIIVGPYLKKVQMHMDYPMTSNLGIVQKELVKKIGGVPLVARVLGRAVKFEGDVERWKEMLKSVLKTPIQEENFVLSH